MRRAYHKLGAFEMTSNLMRVSDPCYITFEKKARKDGSSVLK